MNLAVFVALAIVAQISLVGGQVLLKMAVGAKGARLKIILGFARAIGCMTIYFLLWMALARYVPVSQLAPFDAAGMLILVIAARLVLREKFSARSTIGVALIVAGIGVIAFS